MQKDCLTRKSFADEGEERMINTGVGRYVELLQSRKLAQLLRQRGRLFNLKPCS